MSKILNAIRGAGIGWQMRDIKIMSQSVLPIRRKNIQLFGLDVSGRSKLNSGNGNIAIEAFAKNVTVYRCVRLIADASADVDLTIERGGERLKQHAALDLLKNPQGAAGDVDGVDFMAGVYSDIALYDEAFIVKVGGGTWGGTTALDKLNPDRVSIIYGKRGSVTGYQYISEMDGKKLLRKYPKKQVVHIKGYNPIDDHAGLSPTRPAALAIEILNGINASTNGLIENQGRPAGALTTTGELTDDQFERLQREIQTRFGDASRAGEPMVLDGGLSWVSMGYSPQEAALLDHAMRAAREIALAMGVPPMLLGIPGDNTYSNYQEAQRAFYRQTVRPMVRRTLSRLSMWMIWQPSSFGGEFGDRSTRFSADWLSVPVIAADLRDQMRALNEISFMTIEEKRRRVGLPDAPKNGELLLISGVQTNYQEYKEVFSDAKI